MTMQENQPPSFKERWLLRLRKVGSFSATVFKNFFRDQCMDSAGSLTFTTLLSIVPTGMIILWILSGFEHITDLSLQAEEFILNNLVPEAANEARKVIINLSERRHHIPFYASIMLVVTALLLIQSVDEKINRIWHRGRIHKPGLRIIYYMLILFLGPILLGLSLALTSYISSMSIIQHGLHAVSGAYYLLGLIPPLFTLLLFILLFKYSPREKVRIRHAAGGALLSAVLFECGKYIFSWYVLQFPNYTLIYGALSFFPIFLIWLYLSWCIILLGVETSFALSNLGSKANVK